MTSFSAAIYFMSFSVNRSHKSSNLLSCENVQPSVGRLQMVYPGDTLKRLPCSSYLNERLEIAKRCLFLRVLSTARRVNSRPTHMKRSSTTYSFLSVSLDSFHFLPLLHLRAVLPLPQSAHSEWTVYQNICISWKLWEMSNGLFMHSKK